MSKETKEKVEVQVEETEVQAEATATEAEEQKKVVETTAETVTVVEKIPAKVRVGNFIRKHRTAIVGAVTGVTGVVAGLVLGVKIGKDSMTGSVDTAELPGVTGVDALPDQDYNSIQVDIPENTNVM